MWQNGDGCDCEAVVSRFNKAGELEKLPRRRNIVDWIVSASETGQRHWMLKAVIIVDCGQRQLQTSAISSHFYFSKS